MRPVSSRFLSTLRGSHRAIAQAYVVAGGQTGVSPTGTEIPIISGDVQLDAQAAIRSTLALTTDGTGMFPDESSDLLTPYGNEIFVRRGIAFGGGSIEWVSLGYFRIHGVEQDGNPNSPIRVQAQDRMAGILDARLLAPVQYGATATNGDVMSELVTEVYPWADIEWDDDADLDPLGRTLIAEEDRHKFLDELVTSLGKIWYWDHRGILVIKNAPDPDDPVWEVDAGANGVLVAMSRDLSREGVYNAVVATGEAMDTETPPRAVAYDDNPDSPTYWDGSFGKVPRFYSSPFITTTQQAQLTANGLLRQKLGLPYNVNFQAIANPALEPWDPVAINPTGARNVVNARRVASDGFSRTETDTWGTADSGQPWAVGSGLTANFDVAAGAGTIGAGSANLAQYVTLTGTDESDVEGYFTASVPNAATGAALAFGAVVRRSPSNYYICSFEFQTGGAVAAKIWRVLAGDFEELGALNPIPGKTYTAGQRWRVRWRVAGTQLKVKAWPEGDAEPSTWAVTAEDSAHTSGEVGLWTWRVASNTNAVSPQFAVDDYEVSTFPGLAAGAQVHVIDRLTIPLSVTAAMSADTREQTLIVIGEDA